MKKVKYIGELESLLPLHGLSVKKGDVVEVEDEFVNALFEEILEEKEKSVSKNKEVK